MINHRKNLIYMLICLTLLFIGAQLALFYVHYKVSELINSLVNSSISLSMFRSAILFPIITFVVLQLSAYVVFVTWIWFIANACGALAKFSRDAVYWLGLFFWVIGVAAILGLNAYFYPNSFFAEPFIQNQLFNGLLLLPSILLLIATVFAYVNFFGNKHYRASGWLMLILMLGMGGHSLYEKLFLSVTPTRALSTQPDIIFIGIDSLRPDFIGFFQQRNIKTPNLDQLLKDATVFTHAYSPIARTFPAWISILTAKYPKHSHARINIADPVPILQNDSLPKHLKAQGYETVYGTDEPRFTDINEAYGFDRIVGPKAGIVEFILGGLGDFPLTNLLVNLPFGRILFPYNYGNRAADITYQPNSFLRLVSIAFARPHDKPVFLSLHLCLPHWPFNWAEKHFSRNIASPDQYLKAVERVDEQLGDLLKILKNAGLMEHSLVVVFSDHGSAIGLLGDRVIDAKHYLGNPKNLKKIKISRLSGTPQYSLDFKHDYSINTSFGSGTDVLSLKQHQVLLMFKRFGMNKKQEKGQLREQVASLVDISPTVLALLDLKPMSQTDGISLKPYLSAANKKPSLSRAVFFETGDKVADLETDQILVEKIVNQTIGSYLIDANTGQLVINPITEKSIIQSKQRAVLFGDWLLARYPAEKIIALVPKKYSKNKELTLDGVKVDKYYVLVNLKTNQWTMDLASPFAKKAPVSELLKLMKGLYGSEV